MNVCFFCIVRRKYGDRRIVSTRFLYPSFPEHNIYAFLVTGKRTPLGDAVRSEDKRAPKSTLPQVLQKENIMPISWRLV